LRTPARIGGQRGGERTDDPADVSARRPGQPALVAMAIMFGPSTGRLSAGIVHERPHFGNPAAGNARRMRILWKY